MGKSFVFVLLIIGISYFPAKGQMKILPLGNSITQGSATQSSYRKPLWDLFQTNGINVDFVGSLNEPNGCGAYPNVPFDQNHEGHWGWTVDQLLDGTGPGGPWNCRVDVLGNDISDWLTGVVPDVALVHLGTNDMIQNQDPATTITEISAVIDALRVANPAIQVYLALLIPNNIGSYNMRINSLNALIPNFVTSKTTPASPVYLVDQNTGFNAATDTYDDTHPNNAGEQKIAQNWYNALVSTLPVGLTALEAEVKEGNIELTWETAWELNNKEFEVEYWEEENQAYQKIGSIAGEGTVEGTRTYKYPAGRFVVGTHIFRLKQIDFDGKFSFSRSLRIEIENNSAEYINIYPNPTDAHLNLSFPRATRKGQQLRIFDLSGQLLLSTEVPAQSTQFKVETRNLIPGLYLLEVEGYKGNKEQYKFSVSP